MFFKFYADGETRTQNPVFLAIIQGFVKMGVEDVHKMSWGSMEVVGVLFPWSGVDNFSTKLLPSDPLAYKFILSVLYLFMQKT